MASARGGGHDGRKAEGEGGDGTHGDVCEIRRPVDAHGSSCDDLSASLRVRADDEVMGSLMLGTLMSIYTPLVQGTDLEVWYLPCHASTKSSSSVFPNSPSLGGEHENHMILVGLCD